MNKKLSCIFNWSGGKDSSLALYHCLNNPELDIKYLVTTVNDSVNRVSMHGVREELLIKQAESIGIPLYQIRLPEMPGMKEYDDVMHFHLQKLKIEGVTHSIFGDIFLEDLKQYREDKLAEAGLKAIFPLWKQDTKELIDEFLALGFKTIIVCVQSRIEQFVGQIIDADLTSKLPLDIDVCGENGEFHTFAYEGPIFKKPIYFKIGEKVFKELLKPKTDETCFSNTSQATEKSGYWYIDLVSTKKLHL